MFGFDFEKQKNEIIAKYLPKSDPVLTPLIEKCKTMKELSAHPNVQKAKPEEAKTLNSGVSLLTSLLEKINPLGHFFKDNKDVMDNVHKFDEVLGTLNTYLTKIRNMNIVTKCVVICVVNKKLKHYMALFEEYKSKF